jgi:muramidase (phage lysozyme)
MENSIPAGAMVLLRFIAETETGREPPECYEVVFGHNQRKMKKPLTQMTLDEVEADGPRRTKAYGSSAAGAYQFMRDTLDKPGTLQDLEGELKLTGKEIFNSELQDLLGYHLLKRRGYIDFVRGKIGRVAFAKRLAQEWASFPVLTATKGAHRQLTRGQSYYAGDGLNKALISPEKVEKILNQVLAVHSHAEPAPIPAPRPAPAPAPQPVPEPAVAGPQSQATPEKTADVRDPLVGILLLAIAAMSGVFAWLALLPCNLFKLWC